MTNRTSLLNDWAILNQSPFLYLNSSWPSWWIYASDYVVINGFGSGLLFARSNVEQSQVIINEELGMNTLNDIEYHFYCIADMNISAHEYITGPVFRD